MPARAFGILVGPRLEYILYNATAVLLDCGNTSLLGVNRILTDERYRAWFVRQIKDPLIGDFWANEYKSYGLCRNCDSVQLYRLAAQGNSTIR